MWGYGNGHGDMVCILTDCESFTGDGIVDYYIGEDTNPIKITLENLYKKIQENYKEKFTENKKVSFIDDTAELSKDKSFYIKSFDPGSRKIVFTKILEITKTQVHSSFTQFILETEYHFNDLHKWKNEKIICGLDSGIFSCRHSTPVIKPVIDIMQSDNLFICTFNNKLVPKRIEHCVSESFKNNDYLYNLVTENHEFILNDVAVHGLDYFKWYDSKHF